MKNAYLGILLVLGLVLVACGDLSEAPQPNQEIEEEQLEDEVGEEPQNSEPVEVTSEPLSLPEFSGRTISIGVRGLGQDNVFLRHYNKLIEVAEVTPENVSSIPFREDASWQVVDGLGGSKGDTCFSFESLNTPGHYLRHMGARVRLSADDSSKQFKYDATWCTRRALDGATDEGDETVFSFEALSRPGHYLRQHAGDVWLAKKGGPQSSDTAQLFESNASWGTYLPLSQLNDVVTYPSF